MFGAERKKRFVVLTRAWSGWTVKI